METHYLVHQYRLSWGEKRIIILPARAIVLVLVVFPLLAARVSAAETFRVPGGWPKMIAIPRIKVRAPLESIAFRRPSDVKAPYRWDDAAWYSRGARPGDPGRAIIFGHLDSYCCPAVFWQLSALRYGDTVLVTYPTGRLLTFKVMWQHTYPNSQFPGKWMAGRVRERGLVLITCAGVFHRDGTGYDQKLLVYARLLLPSGRLG